MRFPLTSVFFLMATIAVASAPVPSWDSFLPGDVVITRSTGKEFGTIVGVGLPEVSSSYEGVRTLVRIRIKEATWAEPVGAEISRPIAEILKTCDIRREPSSHPIKAGDVLLSKFPGAPHPVTVVEIGEHLFNLGYTYIGVKVRTSDPGHAERWWPVPVIRMNWATDNRPFEPTWRWSFGGVPFPKAR